MRKYLSPSSQTGTLVSAGGRFSDDQVNQRDDNNGGFSVSVLVFHISRGIMFNLHLFIQRPRRRWAPLRGSLVQLPWHWWEPSAATSLTRRRSCASVYNVSFCTGVMRLGGLSLWGKGLWKQIHFSSIYQSIHPSTLPPIHPPTHL